MGFNSKSRSTERECCSSIKTVSVVVTHPEHAKQSANDAWTMDFGSLVSDSFGTVGLEEDSVSEFSAVRLRRPRRRTPTASFDVPLVLSGSDDRS